MLATFPKRVRQTSSTQMLFVLDADGEAGSKKVDWDDLKTFFPDVMNESQVSFLGALSMSYIF